MWRQLSYSNVVATLALLFAMSGGAIAASGGFAGSGGKLQGCVSGNGSFTLAKAGKKCKKGQTSVSWNQTGPAGPKGTSGTTGATGAPGASSAGTTAGNANALGGKPPSAYPSNVVIRQKTLKLEDNSTAGAGAGGGPEDGTVSCAAGEHVIGGGVRIDASEKDQAIASSRPTVGDTGVPAEGGTADGWRGVVADTGGVAGGSAAEVFAICAS